MKIFLDFDDVLFNTRDFVIDYKKLFSRHGISEEIFKKCYYENCQTKSHGKVRKYDPEVHLKNLSLECDKVDIKKLKKEIGLFSKTSKRYLFPDVEKFLENFKKSSLFLISFSITGFQKEKIRNAEIAKYFQKVIIVNEMKSGAVRKIFSGLKLKKDERVFFVDDRVEQIEDVKNKFPCIKTVLLKRKKGRYNDAKNKSCDFEAENMRALKKIIKDN